METADHGRQKATFLIQALKDTQARPDEVRGAPEGGHANAGNGDVPSHSNPTTARCGGGTPATRICTHSRRVGCKRGAIRALGLDTPSERARDEETAHLLPAGHRLLAPAPALATLEGGTLCKAIESPWLRAEQAREYLQIGNNKLSRLLNTGEIPSYKRGNTRFVHADDLDAYMRSLPSGANPVAQALATTSR